MSKWIKIIENDSFIVEYNKETNTYRVSYFEDNHFKDEICFRGYKELEWKEVAPETEKTWTTDELQKEIRKIMKPPYIYQDIEDTIANIPDACKTCSNHPRNGGNGNCNCTLGLQEFTYASGYDDTYSISGNDTIAIQNSVNGVTFTAENSKFDLDTFLDRYCYFCEHQNACPGPLTHLQTCEHKDKMKEGEVK